jgi:RNA polymerase sigma-70 factor (ECF subfamily)
MAARSPIVSTTIPDGTAPDAPPATLGDLLYADATKRHVPESEWVALVHSMAGGNQHALQELYGRSHRIVFTLITRIVRNRPMAEELTLDVFHDVWRRASAYDPSNGTVVGWIMNQARSRAIDRLRFEQRKKRVNGHPEEPDASPFATSPPETIEQIQRAHAVRAAVLTLTAAERQTIEAAFFAECTHTEIATRLNEPLGTVKTRIRSGLTKLRRALTAQMDSQ